MIDIELSIKIFFNYSILNSLIQTFGNVHKSLYVEKLLGSCSKSCLGYKLVC